MKERFWEVAVNAPLSCPLTYRSDDPSMNLQPGQPVRVPLGKGQRQVKAVVLREIENQDLTVPSEKLKTISSIIEPWPILREPYLRWSLWLSEYYLHPLGPVLLQAYPPLEKKEGRSRKKQVIPDVAPTAPPKLTEEQRNAIEEIKSHQSSYATHLLFGVTGSGKTEVYLQCLHEVLARGQKGLVLVPEIALTPQLLQRFAARFGKAIAVLHSQLTEREKTEQWWSVVDNKSQILIGARSALFCPIENLGLIIVDEEHEMSYKQEEKLKYHARDAAVMRARLESCPLILGSATPSLETWKNSQAKKYSLSRLSERVESRALPQLTVIDMRKQKEDNKRSNHLAEPLPFWLSPTLFTQLTETLERREQAALFLNRRGVAQTVLCPGCGHVVECPNCAISLTLHGQSHLVCHYCDYAESLKETCPECRQYQLKVFGLGTEQVEADLKKLFPEKTIARADRDEIYNRQAMEQLIEDVEKRHIDIIIGTQMIAKGLDFPGLTLVGIVLADISFNLPDFRACERSFQLITQVSGRAGRHLSEGGRVVIQTYNPDYRAIKYALQNDYEGFASEELAERRALRYPPVEKLALLRLQGPDEKLVQKTSQDLAHHAQRLIDGQNLSPSLMVLGPVPAPLAKIRRNYRYQLLIKSASSKNLSKFVHFLLDSGPKPPPRVRILPDVDPYHLM